MRKIGDHAVVLGAGMAGLLAARVLAEAYSRVTLIDRDRLRDPTNIGAASRRADMPTSWCPAERRSSTASFRVFSTS
jgi:glycine/D-amino acid oxidase-like deaminating enzyme